jgi:alkyl hydroperoxide reductase subunit F
MEIKVYSTQTCPYCHQLKAFLDQNKVEYKDIDVGIDQKAAQEMVEKSGQMGVPVTEIDGEMILGFDVQALKEKLNLK